MQCDYVFHKSCAELPKQIIHFFHPQHPLTLHSKSPYGEVGLHCSKCKESVWGFTYHCSICQYDLDIKCVQLGQIVNHEGHQHSFMVLRPTSFACDICKKNSNGMGYTCSTCQLRVHKHCASLPISDTIHTFNLPSTFPTVVEDFIELQHFSHDHPLILNDQTKDGDSGINCNGCLRPASGDTYECRQCEFVLHKSCVELPKQIIHFFHPQHPLTLFSKSPYDDNLLICCHNCDEFVWGFVYYCSICEYLIDMKCVQMGPIVNVEGHEHSFMVFRPSSFTCDICEETSIGMGYFCSTCQLWVHKHCASLPISDSIHTCNLPSTFPTLVDDIQDSQEFASQEERSNSPEENDMLSMIQHFSHECQLILTNDEPLNEETSDELENEEIYDEPQNAKICDGCVRPISAPFYKCADDCKFFLHHRCAQLPTAIRSILHPHPLTLYGNSTQQHKESLFTCATCKKICTGFRYECKQCFFGIDARCASISKYTLKHDGHEHILSLVQKFPESKCSACGEPCYYKFSCEDCDFNLDVRCALLPLTARLGWDEEKHPLKLTYVNVEHISKFYFCDLCEEVRNPDDWYYCCKECDRSAHTTCLFGKHDVMFGATYRSNSLHYHEVKLFSESSWRKCVCKSEGCTDNTDVVLECPTCDYHTHVLLAEIY